MRKSIKCPLILGIFLLVSLRAGAAEDVKTFCSQTCSLFPKLCATGTLCLKLCKVPANLMKVCRDNKIPMDTSIPNVTLTKQQFCQYLCAQPPAVCAGMTYCIQICKTRPETMKACIQQGTPLDTFRPSISG